MRLLQNHRNCLFNFHSCLINYFLIRSQLRFVSCVNSQITSDAPVFKNPALLKYIESLKADLPNLNGSSRIAARKQIQVVGNLITKFITSQKNIASLSELKSVSEEDTDFMKSVDQEIEEHKKVLNETEETIITELIPFDERENCKGVMLEVMAGVGGQEAMLFAQTIFDAYRKYASFKGWAVELTDFLQTDIGGLRHASMIVTGKDCFKLFRYEGGVHRVQRIPKTESKGRVHTSTATVAILPQPSEIDIVINDKDLKIETKTARGPGGQNVNKVETAVRIHHLPSGIIVDCQVERTQGANKKIAMKKLRTKLYQYEYEKAQRETRNLRKYQVGTAARNEKVRTYNFPQDRVTDHRFNVDGHNLEKFFAGDDLLDKFLTSLLEIHYLNEKKQFLEMLASKYS